MDLPFDANRKIIYESVIITQFVNLLLCADANCLLNALLINLILHIGGQIDILREGLKEVFPKNGKCNPSHFTIKKIIKKHQKIIKFSEHIEDLYTYIAMVLFVSDTLIICCLGFTIVASIGQPDATKNIIRNFLFYIVINVEAFIYCFAGEYLSAKSKSIGDAAYASLWYESDYRDSRIILSMIMRSQSQLTITIGKIMNLSLERFTSIVKASVSYISVLLAMY
ncbi:odorant receptor 67c-like [Mycetomoellerius zeteki]|uniref:odorant receptor 67c-like n=1 Tax=Mycetomoellerius zeteki TaxID=64791 RepID=UPI00084E86CD|nr:PREDICTED: odorant receptor 67c-like [Trachymyrmex zeteki]